VTVAIGALAEDALVLFRRPGVVPIKMCGGEFGFACKEDHDGPGKLDVLESPVDAMVGQLAGRVVATILPGYRLFDAMLDEAANQQVDKERNAED